MSYEVVEAIGYAILINTETGECWILCGDGDLQYWEPISTKPKKGKK